MKQILKELGGLSTPSKMPCHGWSISAKKCKTGARLHGLLGSICSKCYAMRGNYPFPSVAKAHDKRLISLNKAGWVEKMAAVINAKESNGYFRWFDSGDLQSVKHLEKIVAVCRLTPTVKHWLPTKEYGFVRSFLKTDTIPDNLTVRLSGYFFDGPPPEKVARDLGVQTSTVHRSEYTCKAPAQGNQCLDCRMCWDKTIANVSYHAH